MVVADLVKIGANFMNLLSKYDIKMEDSKYLNLYSDYANMVSSGNKITYVVACLSEKYDLSEASIYRLLRRFNRTVKD